eukprot:gene27360-37314_t
MVFLIGRPPALPAGGGAVTVTLTRDISEVDLPWGLEFEAPVLVGCIGMVLSRVNGTPMLLPQDLAAIAESSTEVRLEFCPDDDDDDEPDEPPTEQGKEHDEERDSCADSVVAWSKKDVKKVLLTRGPGEECVRIGIDLDQATMLLLGC